jgi:hypothetical protein
MKPFGILRRTLAVAALLTVAFGHQGVAQLMCPPTNGGPAAAVPGKPGETGWLLGSHPDGAGDLIQEWCLTAKTTAPTHTGPDFGYRYISADGKIDVWVGACVFGCGKNNIDTSYSGSTRGVPNKFTKLTWINEETPPAGTNNWDFSYNPATDLLTVNKTTGKWTTIKNPRDPTKTVEIFTDIKTTGTDTYAAPTNFSDLKFMGNQITLAPGSNDGVANNAYGALVSSSGAINNIDLQALDLGGDGSVLNPFVGLETSLISGDTFNIGGIGITNASVSGLASTANYGGWKVQSFDSTQVTFVDTSDQTFEPGTDITGFEIDSSVGIAGMPWALVSADENSSSSGSVVPTPEPSTFALLLSCLSAMYCFRIWSAGVARPTHRLAGLRRLREFDCERTRQVWSRYADVRWVIFEPLIGVSEGCDGRVSRRSWGLGRAAAVGQCCR